MVVDKVSTSLQVTFVLISLFYVSGNCKEQTGNHEFIENNSLAERILQVRNTEIEACELANLNIFIKSIPAAIVMGICP